MPFARPYTAADSPDASYSSTQNLKRSVETKSRSFVSPCSGTPSAETVACCVGLTQQDDTAGI